MEMIPKSAKREGMMTTMELCEKLGVSRSWVNTHLRELGTTPEFVEEASCIRSVLYSEEKVVEWLNSHAVCSVQTQRISALDYATADEIEAYCREIEAKAEAERTENKCSVQFDLDMVLAQFLPSHLYLSIFLIDPRKRGQIPWVPVDRKIQSLDELQSVKDLAGGGSPELAYRYAYSAGLIRYEVDGRKWFVDPDNPETREWSVLVPYQQQRR